MSVTSTVMRSIETRPAIGTLRPAIRTCPRACHLASSPSAARHQRTRPPRQRCAMPRGAPACGITDSLTGRHVVDGENAGGDGHDWRDRRAMRGARLSAVQGIPGPREIKMIGLAQHQPVGGGQRTRNAREQRRQGFEGEQLIAVLGVGRVVGAREMTHQKADIECAQHAVLGASRRVSRAVRPRRFSPLSMCTAQAAHCARPSAAQVSISDNVDRAGMMASCAKASAAPGNSPSSAKISACGSSVRA